MTDISRSTSGVLLPTEVSSEILSKVQEASIIQTAARRVAMPGAGVAFRTITGEPAAEWVGETDSKPVSNGTVGSKTMRPYKLAVIEAFSNEFRRDLPALYGALAERLPLALAKKFDNTVFHGNTPGSDFDTLVGATQINLAGGVYDGFVGALTTVANAGYDFNGAILAPQGEALLYGEKDGNDRPLFINNVLTQGSIGSVLGRPVFRSRHAYKAQDLTVGYAGDWTKAMWGTVEGVQVKISDQATLNVGEGETINLFQQNMFAVLAEIEVGFMVQDDAAFVKFIND